MANDPMRLTTADLRRRLLAPAAAPAAEPAEPAAVPASAPPARSLASRLVAAPIPEEPPGDDGYALEDLLDAGPAAPHTEPTPVPFHRVTPTDLRRPTGRSSHVHARPSVPAAPAVDPVVEQLRRETEAYRQEAESLQQLMEEMRQLLQEASEQEHRMQAEVADRDEKLAAAQARIQELETIVNTRPKTKSELEEWADELERESVQLAQARRAMEADRKQLRDDEAALEKQMREMEVGMARERALLARQEQELKRLNAEIQHELELMQRGDGVLRDRMALFQRRHAEVTGADGPPPGSPRVAPFTASAHPTPTPKKNDTTGLLRKLFRSGE